MPPFLSRILYVEEIEIQSIEPSSILTGQNTMCCDSVGLQVAGRSAFEEEVSGLFIMEGFCKMLIIKFRCVKIRWWRSVRKLSKTFAGMFQTRLVSR